MQSTIGVQDLTNVIQNMNDKLDQKFEVFLQMQMRSDEMFLQKQMRRDQKIEKKIDQIVEKKQSTLWKILRHFTVRGNCWGIPDVGLSTCQKTLGIPR
jgi:hypothetical protein